MDRVLQQGSQGFTGLSWPGRASLSLLLCPVDDLFSAVEVGSSCTAMKLVALVLAMSCTTTL
jgi:hypothetical protein